MCFRKLFNRLFKKDKKLPNMKLSHFGEMPEFVDLGLSVKWSNKNIGAVNPEDIGAYFNCDEAEGLGVNLPTVDECRELYENCKIVYDKKKSGFVVTGPNGNSIFVPIGGEKEGNAHYLGGYFWTCSGEERGYMQGYNYYSCIYVINKALRKVKSEVNLLKRDKFWINVRCVHSY